MTCHELYWTIFSRTRVGQKAFFFTQKKFEAFEGNERVWNLGVKKNRSFFKFTTKRNSQRSA
jgi:hypothetical protein